MAGQQPSRRQILQALTYASAAAAASSFSRWSYAFAEAQHHHADAATDATTVGTAYKPLFFTAAEYATVSHLAEMILPADPRASTEVHGATQSPRPEEAGATDAGVAEFIDFMASEDSSLQEQFRLGLRWLDETSSPAGFLSLPPGQQTLLLERIAFRKNFQPKDQVGQNFFVLIRKFTVMGFYTSRIGLESLGYPGLRFYAESPAVPQDAFLKTLGV